MKQDDQDWRGGRVFSLVYSAGDDVHELLSDALALYSAENGLNVLAVPEHRRHAARHRLQHRHTARRRRPGVRWRRRGLPDLGRHREPAAGREDGARRRARPRHGMAAVSWPARARTRRSPRRPTTSTSSWSGCRWTPTSGSAPTRWPTPAPTRRSWWSAPPRRIPTASSTRSATSPRSALERGILCHVDACMGGFLLPFLTELGPPGRAVRLPGAGRDVHVGRRAQVRLRVEGCLGDPVPDARAGPQAAVRDHGLARRLLRLDRHGRDPARRAGRGGLGGAHAHRPRRLPRAHPHGARRGAGAASWHRVHRRAWPCAATHRPRCWPSAPAIPTPSTSSPWASGWPPTAGTSTGRTDRTRCTPRCTPGARPRCPRWSPTCGGPCREVGSSRAERRDTTYGQSG